MKLTPDMLEGGAIKPAGQEKPKRGFRKRKEIPEEDSFQTSSLPVEPEESEDDSEEEPVRKPGIGSRLKKVFLILIILFGFLLFVWNMKGMVEQMRLEKLDHAPAKSYDSSYREALDADEEEFEDVNNKRKAEKEQEESKKDSSKESTEEVPKETTDGSADTVQSLKDENQRLTEELSKAKSEALTKEQELNNAKSLLDASTAREEQLRNELGASSDNTSK